MQPLPTIMKCKRGHDVHSLLLPIIDEQSSEISENVTYRNGIQGEKYSKCIWPVS